MADGNELSPLDHPEYDPADFQKNCCDGLGLVEKNSEAIPCPHCEFMLKKYDGYLPVWSEIQKDRLNEAVPF